MPSFGKAPYKADRQNNQTICSTGRQSHQIYRPNTWPIQLVGAMHRADPSTQQPQTCDLRRR
jgi:hypothetical protein